MAISPADLKVRANDRHLNIDWKNVQLNQLPALAKQLDLDVGDIATAVLKMQEPGYDDAARPDPGKPKLDGAPNQPAAVPQRGDVHVTDGPVKLDLPQAEVQQLVQWEAHTDQFPDDVNQLPAGFEGRVFVSHQDAVNKFYRVPKDTQRASDVKLFYVERTGPNHGFTGPYDRTKGEPVKRGGPAKTNGPAQPVDVKLPEGDVDHLKTFAKKPGVIPPEVDAIPAGFEGRILIDSLDLDSTYLCVPPGVTKASDVKQFYVEYVEEGAVRARGPYDLSKEYKGPAAGKPVDIRLSPEDTSQISEWRDTAFPEPGQAEVLPAGFEGRVFLDGLDMTSTYARVPPGTTRASDLKVFYIEVTGGNGTLLGPYDPKKVRPRDEGWAAGGGGLA